MFFRYIRSFFINENKYNCTKKTCKQGFDMKLVNLKNFIGRGTYGDVYKADYFEGKYSIAIKLDSFVNKNFLKNEFEIFKYLKQINQSMIPEVFAYGSIMKGGFTYNAMAMELLGPSLGKLFNECGYIFSLKTTLMLADKMLDNIAFIHTNNIIHCDIKPANFVFDLTEKNKVFLIDYGLSQMYRDPIHKIHIPMKKKLSMRGTVKYCSLNSHRGFELSRRDDLESLAYIIVYFLKGKLPWQLVKGRDEDAKNDRIGYYKCRINLEDLCVNIPDSILFFIKYVRSLKFFETPDYGFLKKLLNDEMKRNKFEYDDQFDWVIKRKLEEKRLEIEKIKQEKIMLEMKNIVWKIEQMNIWIEEETWGMNIRSNESGNEIMNKHC